MTIPPSPRIARNVHTDEALWRQRVLDRLTTAPPRLAKLTYLTAPAGFGKTTTMAQQTQAARAAGASVAWFACDERDSDPVVFAESFSAAILRCGIGLAADSLDQLATTLAVIAVPLLICIDDFEQAACPEVEELITQFLERLPQGVSIIIASRQPPSHHLTRLQLAGKVRIIDAETLRFTRAEAETLLADAMSGAEISHIASYTGGWPFALQLARLRAAAAHGSLEPDLEAGGKIPRKQIFDYLASEVLSTVSATLRQFLMDVAVLEVINAEAANAVREQQDSVVLIRQLCNIRPIAVVDESSWTATLHPLLRDYLIDMAEISAPGRVAALHERAARHLAALGEVHRATRHAVAAGRLAMAADIIEAAGAVRLVANEGVVRARLLLKLLPDALIRQRPRLHMLQMVHRLVEGKPGAIEADFERVEQQLDEDELAATSSCSYDLELTRCMLLIHLSEHAEQLSPWSVLEQTKSMVRLEAIEDPRLLAILLPIEINFLHRLGPIDRCDRRIDEVLALVERGAYTHNSPWIPMYYARSALAKGRLADAERHISQSLRHDVNFLQFHQDSLAQLATSVQGQVAYLRGDIDQSAAHVGELAVASTTFHFEVCFARYIVLARCHFARGEPERALELLNDARTLAVEESLPHLNISASMSYLEISAHQGVPGLARLVADIALEERWTWACTTLPIPWLVIESVARARYFVSLALGQPDLARDTAQQFKLLAHRQGFRVSELMADAMQLQLGGIDGAAKAPAKLLEALLTQTREAGLVQPFVELGTRMMTVLGQWLAQRPRELDQANVVWATRLISVINDAYRERTQSVASKLFTPREVDVLYELAKSSTTKAIARNLALSPETIKHHLKAIFAKLAVGNREDAIRQARERGLIG